MSWCQPHEQLAAGPWVRQAEQMASGSAFHCGRLRSSRSRQCAVRMAQGAQCASECVMRAPGRASLILGCLSFGDWAGCAKPRGDGDATASVKF